MVEVADDSGVSWPTAHAAFVDHAETVLGEVAPVTVLGVDETRRGKPRWTRDQVSGRWLRTDPWDTGFVDLGGGQGLLGQVEGRTGAAVRQWLGEQSEAFRAGITHVVINPSAAYTAAVTTEVLPNAELVVDHFHLVKLANDALTAVQRRVTFDAHGRRGRKQTPSRANRRRLLTARERLSPRGFAAMWNALIDNDPSCQILSAYIAKRNCANCWLLHATAPMTPRSAPGSTGSTAGAPTPTSPNCTAWPPRSRPGRPRSWRSCTPG